MNTMTINFPLHVTGFNDYHDFSATIATLKLFGIDNVKYEEVCRSKWWKYSAIFYVTKDDEYTSLKKEIKRLHRNYTRSDNKRNITNAS